MSNRRYLLYSRPKLWTYRVVIAVGLLIIGGVAAAAPADFKAAKPAKPEEDDKPAEDESKAPWPWRARLGPSASAAIGAGYSLAEGESGGVSILALADVGWFVTDRFAPLLGATLVRRPGDEAVHHIMWRVGAEFWLDPRHYLRLSVGRSVVRREMDNPDDGFDTIATGGGALLLAGVPASAWRWGELSFQIVAGVGLHRGDDDEAAYAAFLATCLELAVR